MKNRAHFAGGAALGFLLGAAATLAAFGTGPEPATAAPSLEPTTEMLSYKTDDFEEAKAIQEEEDNRNGTLKPGDVWFTCVDYLNLEHTFWVHSCRHIS